MGASKPVGGESTHLRIWVWKVKVWELGRGWVDRAGLLSSSEAVGREAGDSGAPHNPSSPHLVSHHPFPDTPKRGLSLNSHLASYFLDHLGMREWHSSQNTTPQCMCALVKWQGNSGGTPTSCQALQRLTQVAGPSQEDLFRGTAVGAHARLADTCCPEGVHTTP